MRWPAFLPALLVVVVLVAPAGAAPEYPALTGRVVDQAGIIAPQSRAELERRLAEHERATGNQVVVVTLDTLQGESIEEYGVGLGRAWGIGRQGEDDGVLLIVAPNEREVRIEVGYGLEDVLTDALASQIVQNEIVPQFRQGSFDAGILAGTKAILQALGGQYRPDAWAQTARPAAPPQPALPGWIVPLLFFGVWALIVFVVRRGNRRRSGPWMGGPGMGGFGHSGGGSSRGAGFSGGGGSFGGGGATGRW